MSASSKKKLRKESSVVDLTEKQRDELKEAKKLKTYSAIFAVVIVLMAVAALVIAGSSMVKRSGILQKKTVAAVVDGNELSSVELSYYFNDAINKQYENWTQSYGDQVKLYLMLMGLDISKPLDQQSYAESDTTWADFFINQAVETAKSDYVLEKMAKAENFTLSEEELKTLDANKDQLKSFVGMYGYKNFKSYLTVNYGPGATEESYDAYIHRSALATAYLRKHSDSMTYDNAQIAEYSKEHFNNFSSFDYVSYFVNSASYLEGGTKGEDGQMTYTDAEQAAALEKAKKAAEALTAAKTPEDLDKAIAAMDINKDNTTAVSAKNKDTLYPLIDGTDNVREWIADSSRKDGDIACLPNELVSSDEEGKDDITVNGYHVILFQSRNDNETPMANVRRISVAFEGGKADPDGSKTFSDEEKAAAKKKAEDLLAQWKDGEATEDTFAKLAVEKSADAYTAPAGGLIEDINPGSYLQETQDWALDSSRKAGDTGIVETAQGYDILFYVSTDELNYRQYMVRNEMHGNDLDAWYESVMEPIQSEAKQTKYLNTGYVIKPSGI